MKKTTIYILFGILLTATPLAVVKAVNCYPAWSGNYTVEANCTWPGNYKVYGNIIVGDKTVTIPNGRVMGINLNNNKVTFTTGKILMSGSAKIDNSVSSRYYTTKNYTRGTSNFNITNCNSGLRILNNANGTPTAFQGGSATMWVAHNGYINCAK